MSSLTYADKCSLVVAFLDLQEYEVAEALEKYATATIDTITLLENYQSLMDLKVTCNFAIGAPGISQAERLYMGIATILLPQNTIHKQIIKGWENLGCTIGSSWNKKVITIYSYEFYRISRTG